MTVRQLIAHLEALCTPGATVYAQGNGPQMVPFLIEGGYGGRSSNDVEYVVLASLPCSTEPGGF